MTIKQIPWQRVGAWWGGTVEALALSPDFAQDQRVLAATSAGLFGSTDGGATWQPSNDGISDPAMLAVVFAPNSQTVYASTAGGRLYTSPNGGLQWQEVANWAGLGQATALAISPNFALDRTLFAATDEGVFRSQDGGQRWESSTFGLHDLAVLCLACAPDFATSEVLWAGTAQGGFYRSRNGGRSWRDSGLGLPDDACSSLLVSPRFAEDQTLYLGTAEHGLFHSTDGGASWAAVAGAPVDCTILSLALAGDVLWVGTSNGLWRGDLRTNTWVMPTGGEFAALALAVGVNVVLAGALDGIYRTTDGGATWVSANSGLAAHAPPVVQHSPTGTLVALDRAGALALLPAGGEQWQPLDPPVAAAVVMTLGVQGNGADATLAVAIASGEFVSASLLDQRGAWRAVEPLPGVTGPISHLAPLATLDEPRWLLGGEADRLYQWSLNGGVRVLPVAPWGDAALLHLAHSPLDTDPRLIAVTARPNERGHFQLQVWETADEGLTWAELAALESELPAVALAWPVDLVKNSLFLATCNRVIRIVQPAGRAELSSAQSWLPEGVNVTGLAISPAFERDQRLWAATSRGVYGSTDGGLSWTPVGEGLVDRAIVALFVVDAAELLAVELGGTAWRLKLGQ